MSEDAFAIEEAMTADAHATVYRARRSDGRRVLLKVLEKRPAEPRELEHFRNELAVAGSLDESKVVRPLSLTTFRGLPTLVRQNFEGDLLERSLSRPLPVRPFLDLAIGIASALEHVHQAGLVHKDLSPRSILVQAGTREVRLSEFGLTSRAPGEPRLARQPELIEGNLPYMSPEQTGRTNRVVDSRSDLYSLGVLFFLMLTGELPFHASDSLGWIHAHVARPPPSPGSLVRELPPLLSALVLKLLAKTPEDRYQSAHGVRVDLERLREGASTPSAAFALGEQDVSDQLKISQHLYGREAELRTLRGELEETLETGRSALVLVSGYSGVGKSALVHELLRSIEDTSGTFLSGKFDVQKQSIPYSAIIQALRQALRDLLGGSDETLSRWRARLGAALGQNGRLIAEVIPETELIFGPQPPVVPLPPLDAERRFFLVLQAFIAAFGTSESPLVLFLDDLQWADVASLKLLKRLLMDPSTHHVLTVGGFRDNEVDSTSLLFPTLEQLREGGVRVEQIALGPLALDHVVALVAETLRRPAMEVRPLAALVHEKTGGNPFFLNQLFDELLRGGLLGFDARAWRWRWDVERIRQHDYADNVAVFLVKRLACLPAETRELVRFAAFVGSTVDPKTLAAVAGVDEAALEKRLLRALEENLLFLGPHGYRFAHDRVQQAALSLVPPEERPSIHLRVGWTLLERTAPEQIDERVFEIVSHLNQGIPLLTAAEERSTVARLNLRAGQKARNAAAPAAAMPYLLTAIELFGVAGWETAHELVNAAHVVGAECAFLLGDASEALRLLDATEEHGRSVLDRAPGRNLRSWLLTNQGRLVEATEYCVETARLLGWELPGTHDLPAIRQATAEAFEAYGEALAGRRVSTLAELPLLNGPTELGLLDTVYRAIPGVYQWNPDLMALLVVKSVLLAAPVHTAPAFFYAQYGIVHGYRTGDYETAYEFGELAVHLAKRPEDEVRAGATYFIHALFLSHLKRHLSVSVELLRSALELSLARGDLVQANYCLGLGAPYRIYAGEALDTIRRDLPEARRVVQASGDTINDGFLSATEQLIAALKGETSSLARLDGAGFSEAEFEVSAPPSVAAIYGPIKEMVRLVGGDFSGAIRASEEFKPLPGAFYNVWHRFYRGLALARQASVSAGAERLGLIERLRVDVTFMATLAKHCPLNHAHRDQLLRAELAVLDGDMLEAIHLYDAAISGAREHAFIQDEALAYEFAAHALRVHGFELAADLYQDEARRAYRGWGAEGKVRELERPAARARVPSEQTFLSTPEAIDVSAIVKASQAISSELSWKRVTERLLGVALEQSGGTHGCLMLKRNGSLLVAALASSEQQAVITRLVDLAPLETLSVAPRSIANFVSRSRELVVIDEPRARGEYSSDPYVRAHRPRSLLCLPILRQSEVSAVLYLENRLATGVFTRPRITALELVAGQAAIALSNAELFEELERENAERARAEVFLRESRRLLQQIIDNTSAMIFVKDVEGRFLLTNRRFEQIVQMPHEDLIGKTDWDLSARPLAESFRIHDALALEANRPLEFEERLDLADGVHTYLSIKFPLHDERGRVNAVCGVATDITARKRAEDDLRESMAREREARAAAEEAVRLRDEFLSVASHELRTPLTSLQLAVHGITRRLEGDASARVQNNLDVAARQVRRLTNLVGTLLDVSRIHAGRLDIERRPVDLAKIVRDTREQLSEDLRRSGSTLGLRVAGPVLGSWDGARMEQVVINLLTNAIKFGEGRPIEVDVRAHDGTARLRVTDHGIGIPEDAQRCVFERFGRGVSARHYGGLGLGLYIVRTIVEAHGGCVSVRSAPGQGATFTVELPQSLHEAKSGEEAPRA